jgi:hypothetical protein
VFTRQRNVPAPGVDLSEIETIAEIVGPAMSEQLVAPITQHTMCALPRRTDQSTARAAAVAPLFGQPRHRTALGSRLRSRRRTWYPLGDASKASGWHVADYTECV